MPPVPQAHASQVTPFAGHAAVVGIVPGQPEIVVRTAADWARTSGATLVLAYVDVTRYVVEERPDGTVAHADVDPDSGGDSWRERQHTLEDFLHRVLDGSGVRWEFRYLAGRPDRALAHLAQAVDAATIIVGTRAPGVRQGLRELVEGSVAVGLAHHQHRPVLVVPLRVVDGKAPRAWDA